MAVETDKTNHELREFVKEKQIEAREKYENAGKTAADVLQNLQAKAAHQLWMDEFLYLNGQILNQKPVDLDHAAKVSVEIRRDLEDSQLQSVRGRAMVYPLKGLLNLYLREAIKVRAEIDKFLEPEPLVETPYFGMWVMSGHRAVLIDNEASLEQNALRISNLIREVYRMIPCDEILDSATRLVNSTFNEPESAEWVDLGIPYTTMNVYIRP